MAPPGDAHALHPVSAIPGRVRFRVVGPRPTEAQLGALAMELAALPGVVNVHAVTAARSLIVHLQPERVSVDEFIARVQSAQRVADPRAAGSVLRVRHPARSVPVQPRAMATSQPDAPAKGQANGGGKQPSPLASLTAPAAAVALAAAEVFPPAIVLGALGVAALPTARRAIQAANVGRLSAEQFDVINLALLAVGGQYLTAGTITFLLGLGALLRGETTFLQQREAGVYGVRHGLDARIGRKVEGLPLHDTTLQKRAPRLEGRAAIPVLALSALASVARRDPAVLIDSPKLILDIQSGIEFGSQTAARTAIINSARAGVIIQGGRAVEKLGVVDFVVLLDSGLDSGRELAMIRALQERGVQVMRRRRPPEQLAPGDESVVSALLQRAQGAGKSVALVGAAEAVSDARNVVRVALGGVVETPPEVADVLLLEGHAAELPLAIDQARIAARKMRQNAGWFAFPLSTALMANLAGHISAPLPTAIKVGSSLAAGVNSLLPLSTARRRQKTRRPQRSTEAAPA